MATLQERIKERRLASGFTLLEVAEMLGVKEATMQRYESGEIKNIKHETIIKMAKIFNCTPQYLMGWSDMQFEHKKANEITLANHEKKVIIAYRDKPEMQPAVDRLLGVEDIHTTPSVRAARSFGDKSKIDRNADIDEQRFIDAPENDIDM